MKKRTACFGWTKKLQRRTQNASSLFNRALKKSPAAAKELLAAFSAEVASIKADHRARIKALRGGV
jgi:hypothetical protein